MVNPCKRGGRIYHGKTSRVAFLRYAPARELGSGLWTPSGNLLRLPWVGQ